MFPMMSTTLEGLIVNNQVTPKNIMDVQIGLLLGKEGRTPTSKVVAAVLGIAMNGPIQSIITVPSTGAIPLFIRFPRSLNVSPEFTIDRIPKKGSKMPVSPNAKIVSQTWFPTCRPINGGNKRLPAPKNMANSANPIVTISRVFFKIWG